jgi:hypothetical protein
MFWCASKRDLVASFGRSASLETPKKPLDGRDRVPECPRQSKKRTSPSKAIRTVNAVSKADDPDPFDYATHPEPCTCALVVISMGVQFRLALDQHFLALGTVPLDEIGDLALGVANNDVDIRPFNKVDEVVHHELEGGNPPSIGHDYVPRLVNHCPEHRVVTK